MVARRWYMVEQVWEREKEEEIKKIIKIMPFTRSK